ncbi:MAG: hypothetical protein M3Z25_22120 [Actinomycetota bacterium]|nr:hypothetical protein [Actinomycetota bacterium]
MPGTSNDTPEPVRPEVVAGLAREVDALRRAVRTLADLPAAVKRLDATLAQAIDDMAGPGPRADTVGPVSWIGQATDPELTASQLAELTDWVAQVYMRYPVAARELPDCWLWHPDMVEELAWLHQSWQAAYSPQTGTVAAAGDWHDRYRPGVAARIRAANRNSCSLENHVSPERPTAAIAAPSLGSVQAVAFWWACTRDCQQPPMPTQADLDAASRRLKEGRR